MIETVKGSLSSDGDIYELCENYSDPSSVTFEFESLKELMKKAKKCFKYVEDNIAKLGEW